MKNLDAGRVWSLVHSARQALIADLDELPADAFNTPSLCAGWTVHDVLAHLVESTLTTRWAFVMQMLRSRGDFDRANALGVERERRAHPAETLAAFRDAAPMRCTPPAPLGSRLDEVYVHGEDIRRPLGLVSDPDPVGVMAAIRYRAGASAALGGSKELLRTVRLVPVEVGAAAVGAGLEVRGRAIDLLLAASGRPIPQDALEGPGCQLIRPGDE